MDCRGLGATTSPRRFAATPFLRKVVIDFPLPQEGGAKRTRAQRERGMALDLHTATVALIAGHGS
jgi:hypothetical protein